MTGRKALLRYYFLGSSKEKMHGKLIASHAPGVQARGRKRSNCLNVPCIGLASVKPKGLKPSKMKPRRPGNPTLFRLSCTCPHPRSHHGRLSKCAAEPDCEQSPGQRGAIAYRANPRPPLLAGESIVASAFAQFVKFQSAPAIAGGRILWA